MRLVELYTIFYSTRSWTYNSSRRDVFYQNKNYQSQALSKQGTDDRVIGRNNTGLVVECPLTLEFIQLFNDSSPTNPITIVIQEADLDDIDGSLRRIYSGFIVDIQEFESYAELVCETNMTLVSDYGLRIRYQPTCFKALYDQDPGGCKANKEANRFTGLVTAIQGRTVTIAEAVNAEDNFFGGAFIEYNNTNLGTFEKISIEFSRGAEGELILISEPDGLAVGQEISFFTGCDRSVDFCHRVHNNRPNYGGTIFDVESNVFVRQT